MRSKWALALLAFVGTFAFAFLSRTAEAQYVPEWDTQRPPADPTRPSEYRTVTTDTWIRLTPYVTYLHFGKDLDLEGGITKTGSGGAGLLLEFDAGDTILITFGFGVVSAVDRIVLGADNDLDGKALHPHIGIALKNPELKFGALQLYPGFGLMSIMLMGYDEEKVWAGGQIDTGFPPYQNTYLFAPTIFLRADIEAHDHFLLGAFGGVHFPIYAYGDQAGLLPDGALEFNPKFISFEANIYFSVAF
ncbi:hypothetical protein ACFL59_01635 [Planctomycetota bacterium]